MVEKAATSLLRMAHGARPMHATRVTPNPVRTQAAQAVSMELGVSVFLYPAQAVAGHACWPSADIRIRQQTSADAFGVIRVPTISLLPAHNGSLVVKHKPEKRTPQMGPRTRPASGAIDVHLQHSVSIAVKQTTNMSRNLRYTIFMMYHLHDNIFVFLIPE